VLDRLTGSHPNSGYFCNNRHINYLRAQEKIMLKENKNPNLTDLFKQNWIGFDHHYRLYSNFRFCFTSGTHSKVSYTVFRRVNFETGKLCFQVGTDGDKQLHCTQLFTDLILRILRITTPQNCYYLFYLVLYLKNVLILLSCAWWEIKMCLFLCVVMVCRKSRQIYSYPEVYTT